MPLPTRRTVTWDINARLSDANAAFQKLIGYDWDDLKKSCTRQRVCVYLRGPSRSAGA